MFYAYLTEILSAPILVTAINVHPINAKSTFYVFKKEKK